MADSRPRIEPGPDHPITITPYDHRVVIRHNDVRIVGTDRALELREASYPPVLYIPLEDVNHDLLRSSDEHTYCPYKGEASYYDIVGLEESLDGIIWYYPDPYEAVAAIKDHVAFYANRVSISDESQENKI